MVKKMSLMSSLCKHPKTLSFRNNDMFKTVNSVFLEVDTPESWFSNSSECASLSTESEGESLETVVRGVRRSERLFFEPGVSSSILEEAKRDEFRCEESEVVVMESEDPYGDFRRSMEEMVQCRGFKGWDCLEGMLGWFLKVNGEDHHGFILGAFVDLLIALSSSSTSCSDSVSFNSALSSLSSSASNEITQVQEEEEEEE